jgi:chromate transporter
MKAMFDLFKIFFKIGMFTLGGGYAMVPIIEEEIVEKNKWMSEDDFLDVLAMAQSLPGPLAVNTATFVGYRLKKSRGAAICCIGTVMPSFLIILVIASLMTGFYQNPLVLKFFMGVRPAVAGLILTAVFKLKKGIDASLFSVVMVLMSITCVAILGWSPIIVIIVAALSGIFIYPHTKWRV